MADNISKEVDAWLGQVASLLKERAVTGDISKMLRMSVETVLKQVGVDKLATMDEAKVLSAVRDGLPKVPGNMLRIDYINKNSDLVAKIVDDFFVANKIRSGGMGTLGDGVVNELEGRIAEYLAKLPSDVTIERNGLTLVISKSGVAAKVDIAGANVDAKLKGISNELKIETKDLVLKFANAGGSLSFDGKLKYVKKDLELLVELHGRKGMLAGDQAGADQELSGKISATFESVRVKTDASLEQVKSKVDYLSKNPALKELSAELTSDYKTVQLELKAAYETKNTKLLVEAVAKAQKLEAKVALETVSSGGLNVNAGIKASLEAVEAKIAIFRKRKDAKLEFVAGLESDYKDLKAKADLIYRSTGKVQVELIAKFEATLDKFKASIEASLVADKWRVTAGTSLDTSGAASGKVEALLQLGKGFQIVGQNTYLKVGATVDAKQWNIFVGISLTSPPKAADVQKLIRAAESNFGNAYDVLNEPAFDAANSKQIISEMNRRLLAQPPKVSLEAGFFLMGDMPGAPVPNVPLTGGVGLKFQWF